MAKLIALVFCAAAGIGLGILILIYGWGLDPRSWWWIIGGGVFGRILLGLVEVLAKGD